MVEHSHKPEHCPECKSSKVANILYGYILPDEKMDTDIKEGHLVLGGCVLDESSPAWQCADCGHQMHKEGKFEWLEDGFNVISKLDDD